MMHLWSTDRAGPRPQAPMLQQSLTMQKKMLTVEWALMLANILVYPLLLDYDLQAY